MQSYAKSFDSWSVTLFFFDLPTKNRAYLYNLAFGKVRKQLELYGANSFSPYYCISDYQSNMFYISVQARDYCQ